VMTVLLKNFCEDVCILSHSIKVVQWSSQWASFINITRQKVVWLRKTKTPMIVYGYGAIYAGINISAAREYTACIA